MRPWIGQMRSAPTRSKQVHRFRPMLAPHSACQFKTNQRSHAVAEKSIRYIQIRLKNFCGLLNGFCHSLQWSIVRPALPPRQLQCAHFHVRRHQLRPVPVDRRAPARKRYADKAESRRRNRPGAKYPRIKCLHFPSLSRFGSSRSTGAPRQCSTQAL